jgi:radical SAM superfamily enzyme YgiQ (UPF0313 family)
MNILIIEPSSVSKYGNQRIWGGNGSLKSSFFKPPHDLMAISGFLEKNGYKNILYDANAGRVNIDELREKIVSIIPKPDVVIFSNSTCTIYQDVTIAKIAKSINPDCLTVAAGVHSMSLYQETFDLEDDLDVIVTSSKWEEVCLNIVQNCANLQNVSGIAYRPKSDIKVNGDQIIKNDDYVSNMPYDNIGFPAHDKLDQSLYDDPTAKRLPKTIVQFQKGCVHVCNFCCQPAFFGAPSVDYRTTDSAIEELKWVQKLGFKEVMFNDATLTGDIEWAKELFQKMIDNNIDLTWNCSTRANRLNPEVIQLMKDAGCHTIMIGLESADKEVLKNIKKSMSAEKVRKVVDDITKIGLDSLIFAVVGFQGETESSVKNTIKFLSNLNATYITFGIAVPAPGTEFYDYVKSNGYLLTDDWSKYDPMKKPVFEYPELSAEQILWYSRYGLKKFYLRPSYIFKRLISIRSFMDFKHLVINFVGFMKRYVFQISE